MSALSDQSADALLTEAHASRAAGLASVATALTDSASVAIYHYPGPGQPLYVNPAYRRMFSVGAELSLDIWAENIHPEDRGRVLAEFAEWEARRPSESFSVQYRRLKPDGEIRFLLETIVPAIGMSGFVGTIVDVTDLVHARAEVERTHKALETASRQAGMAEVASNVLHNVGNVLNSVNVSANLLQVRFKESKISQLARVADMLEEQRERLGEFLIEDKRGKQIPAYIKLLASQLSADHEAALTELSSLVESVEHIKSIVRMQQGYATQFSVIETVSVADLVEDSLRLNAGALSRHGITLEREFADVPPISVDKHRVLQILVNLIRNAKHACDDSKRLDKRITVRVRPCPLGVGIAVIDNGIGIRDEHKTRIFSHGFTTRSGGHGFGLHSAALAAQELQGTLCAASDGPSLGSTFTLELPLASPKS
jgi:signal transduction histidine kinase